MKLSTAAGSLLLTTACGVGPSIEETRKDPVYAPYAEADDHFIAALRLDCPKGTEGAPTPGDSVTMGGTRKCIDIDKDGVIDRIAQTNYGTRAVISCMDDQARELSLDQCDQSLWE